MADNGIDKAYEDLAVAIIKQTMKDYQKARAKYRKANPETAATEEERKSAELQKALALSKVKRCEDFFNSQYCGLLLAGIGAAIDGPELLQRIKRGG